MNILGMGPAELLLIFVIVLIVLGPDKLPGLARTLGKIIRELRRMSLEVTAEFVKELRNMEAISDEVKEATETIRQVADIKRTLVESLEPALGAEEDTAAEEAPVEKDIAVEEAAEEDIAAEKTLVEADTAAEEAPVEEDTAMEETSVKEDEAEDHE